MAKKNSRSSEFLAEAKTAISKQPATSWTVAKFRLAYRSPDERASLISIDNVAAAGECNAQARGARWNARLRRVEIEATFSSFELRGQSHLIGPFRVVLQEGQKAVGRFRQRQAHSLYPLQGEWEVPFLFECRFGQLIPRPSASAVLLKSAEPGEFAIPPIGSWFEKWDPIEMVDVKDPEGPTIAVIEHAMHCMLNAGKRPTTPPFARRRSI